MYGYATGASIINSGITSGAIHTQSAGGGLIGHATETTIDRVSVEGVTVSGTDFLGGFAGNGGNSKFSRCNSEGTVSGSGSIYGGFAARLYEDKIENCYTSTNVNKTGAGNRIGGFAGDSNRSVLTNVFASGTVNAGAADEVGALIGHDLHGTTGAVVTNSFSTSTLTSAGSNVGGLIALTNTSPTITNSVHNTTEANFHNSGHAVYLGTPPWDFTTIWVTPVAELPTLRNVGLPD